VRGSSRSSTKPNTAPGFAPSSTPAPTCSLDRVDELRRFPLWLAAYTPDPISCAPWGYEWTIWQWSSTTHVPGSPGTWTATGQRADWFTQATGGHTAPAPATPAPTQGACKVEMVKTPDKADIWLHGYDRDGEYFTHVAGPDDIDPGLGMRTRLLAAGDDGLDARFRRITGI